MNNIFINKVDYDLIQKKHTIFLALTAKYGALEIDTSF